MKFKTHRICAGEYEIRSEAKTVRVTRVDGLGWIADPDWGINTSDPRQTKFEAVESAIYFLENPECA